MFNSASAFNQDIGPWAVGNVTNMSFMFNGAALFNQNIGNWDVSNATNMRGMFQSAGSFNQPIGGWNVGNVIFMGNMFFFASSFNQPVGSWDVSNVTDMSFMFFFATSFDHALWRWDISNVTNMTFMLDQVMLSTANYDSTLIGWATLAPGETQIPSNISFSGGNSTFCNGENALTTLIGTFNWFITDGGKNCNPPPSARMAGSTQPSLREQNERLTSLIIYPNPVKDHFNIRFREPITTPVEWSLIDYSGKEVMSGTLQQGISTQEITTTPLPSGIYLYRLAQGGKLINTKRLIFTE